MLARALPGVPVLVGADRHASGRVAEDRFSPTVHLLDDGFQHVGLWRDIDLLMVSEEDLTDEVLPAGHLRERLTAAKVADALLVTAGYESAAVRVGRTLGVPTAFLVSRAIGPPYMIANHDSVVVPSGERVFAIAGIARPERFFADIANAGWRVAGSMTFRDHQRFTQHDITRIADQAIAARVAIVLTTEKDAVRLAACDLTGVPIAAVPLTVTIDPADAFESWFFMALSRARSQMSIRQLDQ
jgi:tetraacyldisaccharide 4'-kinase